MNNNIERKIIVITGASSRLGERPASLHTRRERRVGALWHRSRSAPKDSREREVQLLSRCRE